MGRAIAVNLLREKAQHTRKRYSISPRTPKRERLFKVLIDTPCTRRGAIRVPLSRHSGTGLTCWRAASEQEEEMLEGYTGFRESCRPQKTLEQARKHRKAYKHIAPKNSKEDFELLSEDLEKEIFLVLYAHKDPNRNYDWAIYTGSDDYLFDKWME